MKTLDFYFYRCVVCGRKSSDSTKIGGETISFSRKEPPDLWITVCLCGKCSKKFHNTNTLDHKLEELWEEFIRLFSGKKKKP